MAKASENKFPKVVFNASTGVAAASTGTSNLWLSTGGSLTITSSSGGETVVGGSASPLTTKGDLYGYAAADARIPVGTDGEILIADSSAANGVAWGAVDVAITLGAGSMSQNGTGDSGGSTLGTGAAWHTAWICDAASNSAVGATVRIPDGWATVDVQVVWHNDGAGSGDVNLRLIQDAYSDTDTLTATAETAITPTAAGTDVAKVSTLKSGLAVTAGGELMVVIQRRPLEGTDTLGNSIAITHLVIVRAS